MKKYYLTAALLTVLSSPAYAASGGEDPEMLITDGQFFGEIRYRNEMVDQEGFANDADAHTVRTNIGFKTGTYKGFQALVEAQFVGNIGDEEFNSTTNGQTAFPTVPDPDVEEINQLWLSYAGIPDTVIKVGRQAMNLDNQRFIGTVGWRQNDQTFDALQITNSSIENLDLLYSYVANVNRIFGDDNSLGDLDSEIHIANASYALTDWLKLTGYGYWLELDRLAARSSQTYGLRATGSVPIQNTGWTFSYEAEVATQDDYANNTASYDENYYHIAPSIKGHGFSVKVGYEELGGDGTNAFQTPLATLHKFNGWADVFLNTPDNGLQDTYVGASYKVSGTDTHFDGTKFTAVYHDFEGEEGGDYGSEIDLSVGKSFKLPEEYPFDSLNLLVKYADYEADDTLFTDREKIWLQVGVKF